MSITLWKQMKILRLRMEKRKSVEEIVKEVGVRKGTVEAFLAQWGWEGKVLVDRGGDWEDGRVQEVKRLVLEELRKL